MLEGQMEHLILKLKAAVKAALYVASDTAHHKFMDGCEDIVPAHKSS